MNKKIGIYGGSFNPIHIGHLIFAQEFIEQLGLDECIFVPASISPFKVDSFDSSLFNSNDRIEMIKLAIKSNPKFSIDEYEIEKGGISYTIDTINYMRNKYSNSELFLLVGIDQVIYFKEWKDWKHILELVQLCILNRPSYQDKLDNILNDLTINTKKPIIINAPLLEISSTDIRERLMNDKPIKYFVPKEVEEYIYEKIKIQ